MPQQNSDAIRDWTGGVVTSGLKNGQPATTSPHGWNSILTSIGVTGAVPSKRQGIKVVNASNASIFGGAILAQFEYRTVSAGVFTRYHVYVGDDGRIGTIASDPGGSGASTFIAGTIFTGGTVPDADMAKNLLFVVNAVAQKKLRGLVLENFGIARPAAAPGAAVGAAGGMTGTYEIRFTYRNGNTGHESSASDSVGVTVTGQKINLSSVTVSPDSQTTQRRIWIRNTSNQTEFRLATTINDNVTTTLTGLDVNTSLLTVLGPDTTSNEPPPTGTKFVRWFQNRLFVADDSNLYWSSKSDPESFDPENFEPIGEGDGQKITGLFVYSDALFIFKTRSTYVLTGLTPESWRIRPIFTKVGTVSHRSIVEAGGALWWWAEKGPMKWDGNGQPIEVGKLLIGDTIANDAARHLIQGAEDETNKLVVWTYPASGSTRNNRILPLSYRLSAFISDKWDPMDIASLVLVEDNNGTKWLYGGNYNGQMFRFGDAKNDGVPGGTTSGTFVAAGTSVSSITGSGFYTTGVGLAERYVSVEDSGGQLVGRVRITSNTATVLTLASSITGLTIGATYTYYIGGPNFEWDTVEHDSDAPFVKKRYRFGFVQVDATGASIGVDVFTEKQPSSPKRTFTFTATDGSEDSVSKRFSVPAVGKTWQMRVRNRAADVDVSLYDVAMEREFLTSKLG